MLQFRRSLSRQSNPSTLTIGLFPKLDRLQPPFLEVGEDDDRPDEMGVGIGDKGECRRSFSSPNRAS